MIKNVSDITKRCKRRYRILTVLSWLLCFGTATTLIICAVSGNTGKSGATLEDLKGALGSVLWSFIISFLPMILLAIFVKDKIKPLIWTANVIMSNLFIGSWMMYIVFGLYLSETYIILPLKDLYKDRFRINREIDRRGREG